MINATIIEENIITNNRPMDHKIKNSTNTTGEKEKLDRANKSRHMVMMITP